MKLIFATGNKDKVREVREMLEGLDVRVLKDNGEEVELKENIDEENISMRSILEGDRRYRDEENFAGAGFTAQEFRDGELVDAEDTSFGDDVSDGDGAGEDFPGDTFEE